MRARGTRLVKAGTTCLEEPGRGRQVKALVEAYECSPARKHAPGSAWQIVSRLARRHELWILTEKTQYEAEVRAHLSQNPQLAERLHFTFIPRRERPPRKGARPVLPIRATLDYRGWLRRAFKVAVELHHRVDFQLTHHLRGDSFREPGLLWKLPVPFVWGPTGGTNGVPRGLMGAMDMRNQVLHAARNFVSACQIRFSPKVRQAARRATCVFAQSQHDRAKFQRIHRIEAVLAHEQAADPSRAVVRRYDGRRALKVAWAGRCVALKGVPILLRALSHRKLQGRLEAHMAGDGPLLRCWQAEAARLGVARQCRWHGWLSGRETTEMMSRCDVLAFPSLLEATSATVMQALSMGLPAIVLGHSGSGDVVDETWGFRIRVQGVCSAVRGFANALLDLVENPHDIERLSRGASRRAQEYSWDRLVNQMDEAYERAVSTTGSQGR